ncbi:hypothetical protein FRB99_003556 [Tulasnella sp. 403]|nr:hypothetical protein FRB99_003556 [Tulasnella sp. 403]
MDNRTLSEFIAQEPDCDRPKFLFEICAAVVYLHDVCEVIHGDIRAENILVSPERHALLCDFGLTRPKAIEGPDLAGAGTRNWQSPELFDGQESSTSSDVYAFGMTIYEASRTSIPLIQVPTQ